jgi:hypothetical protein
MIAADILMPKAEVRRLLRQRSQRGRRSDAYCRDRPARNRRPPEEDQGPRGQAVQRVSAIRGIPSVTA